MVELRGSFGKPGERKTPEKKNWVVKRKNIFLKPTDFQIRARTHAGSNGPPLHLFDAKWA